MVIKIKDKTSFDNQYINGMKPAIAHAYPAVVDLGNRQRLSWRTGSDPGLEQTAK
jgi:hypothetical protein